MIVSETLILGNTLESWGTSILIFLIAILVTRIFSFLNKKVIKPLARKTSTPLDDAIATSFESPVLFGIMLVGIWVAIHRLHYPENMAGNIDNAYKILIILNVTWFFSRLANSMIEVYWANGNPKKMRQRIVNMLPVMRRMILVIIWIIGVVMALSNIGVNISALLGTLGIGGIAFALAAQDTIKNIFGAFTILTDRPFNIGDIVKIDSFEGTIIDVGVRSTKMRNYDKRIITFPNYKIADASIVNISAEPMRRVVLKLGLTYSTSPEKMKEAIELLRTIPTKVKFVSPKDLKTNFSDFGDSALVITFVYFIEKKGDIRSVISDVNMEILTSFSNAGLDFAFPTQTIYIRKEEA